MNVDDWLAAALLIAAVVVVLAFAFFESHPRRDEGLTGPVPKHGARMRRIDADRREHPERES